MTLSDTRDLRSSCSQCIFLCGSTCQRPTPITGLYFTIMQCYPSQTHHSYRLQPTTCSGHSSLECSGARVDRGKSVQHWGSWGLSTNQQELFSCFKDMMIPRVHNHMWCVKLSPSWLFFWKSIRISPWNLSQSMTEITNHTLRSEMITQLIPQKLFRTMIARILRNLDRNNSSEIFWRNDKVAIAQIYFWKHATRTARKQRATTKLRNRPENNSPRVILRNRLWQFRAIPRKIIPQ